MATTEEKLKQAGLAGNEAKVFLELLKRGSINGSELAKKVGLDRTLTYQVLNKLAEKGLVNYIMKEKKKYFSATNPDNLLRPVNEQVEFIQNLIPELKNIEKLKEVEQFVEVYEGISGLKVMYEEVLKSKDFCFFGGTGKSYEVLHSWEMKRIEKEIERRGMNGRGVMDSKIRGKEFTKVKGLKVRYLDNVEAYNTAFGITEDKISIHCLAQEKPIVIFIKNKFIVNTLKNYFEFMWSVARP